VQYCLSTETKGSLPCDLTSQEELDIMISLLRPLTIVPAILANGQHSKWAKKAVVVQVFNKNDEASGSGDSKVSDAFVAIIPIPISTIAKP
jgi:hypothetical protein